MDTPRLKSVGNRLLKSTTSGSGSIRAASIRKAALTFQRRSIVCIPGMDMPKSATYTWPMSKTPLLLNASKSKMKMNRMVTFAIQSNWPSKTSGTATGLHVAGLYRSYWLRTMPASMTDTGGESRTEARLLRSLRVSQLLSLNFCVGRIDKILLLPHRWRG
jgi:hypothetical protein